MKRYHHVWPRSLVIMVLASLWLVGAFQPGALAQRGQQGESPAPVVVEPLRTSIDRREIVVIGTGLALRSVDLHPSVIGRVVAVPFIGGEEVAVDEVILRLDDAQQQVQLESARIERDQLARTIADA